jgi:ABC-type uncharacterized transport system permease subunit
MIETGTLWLRVAACLYAVGLLHSLLTAVRHGRSAFRLAMGAFRVAVVLHGVAIVDRALALGRIPVDTVYQTLSLCAFITAIVFVVVESRYRLASTSVAVFPLVFAMTLAGAMEPSVGPSPDQRLREPWLVLHILLVLAGYAALLFTAVAAFAYLVQERRLKRKQSSALLERLPPLATLDTMLSKALGLGFAFLTLGLVFGVMWAFIYVGTGWIGEPAITVSLLTWGLLLVMMLLRASAGWRGRKAAVMALAVLGCSALTWVMQAGFGASLIP